MIFCSDQGCAVEILGIMVFPNLLGIGIPVADIVMGVLFAPIIFLLDPAASSVTAPPPGKNFNK